MAQATSYTSRLYLLGPVEAQRANGQAIPLRRKMRALLAYLAVSEGIHSRHALCDLFFPNADDPLGALRWQLSQLRRLLGSDALFVDGDHVQFNPRAVWVDYLEFRRLLDSLPAQLEAAIGLYRGEFLEALSVPDAPDFELWLLGRRADFQQRYARALNQLIAYLKNQGQEAQALPYAEKLVRNDPLLEEAHMQLIWLYARTGQRDAALAQCERCRTILQQGLAVEPTPECRALCQEVQQGRLGPEKRAVVLGPAAAHIPVPPAALVGRDAELERLRQLWQQASTGRGQVVLVEAEAGGGKTHLVRTFVETVDDRAAFVGQCYESTQALPYSPWIELMETSSTTLKPADIQRLSIFARRHLAHLAPSLVEIAGDQPALLAQHGDVNQDHLAQAVVEFISNGFSRPLLFFLDDLQWADESSLQLFQRLAQRTSRLPLLLVAAFRPEETEANQPLQILLRDLQRSNTSRLRLAPLPLESVGRLVEILWPELPPGYRTQICRSLSQSTGGNPFFITEVVRELRHSEGPPATLPIPESVRSLIGGRLAKLPPGNRQLLEALAILDSPATLPILQQTSARSEDETVNAIEIGLRWGMVAAQGAPGDVRYDFSHDLVRSAVIGQLSAPRRQVLHRRAAETLETTYSSAAVLTYHWALAGNQEKERWYAALAGEQAAARSAHAEAITYLTRALALTPIPAQAERYRLLLVREKVFSSQSELERQEQDLAALQQLADALDDNEKRAEIAIRHSDYLLTRGNTQDACRLAEQAVALAVAAENKRLEAQGRRQWSLVLWQQGKFLPAQEQARQAYSLLQSEKLQMQEPRILVMLGNIAWALADFDSATAYYEQAMPVCRTVGDRVGEGHVLSNLGIIAIERGDYRTATNYYEQALQIYQETGSRQAHARVLANLGEVHLDQGAYTTASRLVEESISISEEIGAWRDAYRHRARLSLIRHYLGDERKARQLLESVLLQAQGANDDYTLADVWTKLGHLHLDAGDGTAAVAAYEQALVLQRQVGAQKQVMECLAGLAGGLLHEEDLEGAQAHVETILDFLEADTLDGAIEPFRVYWACYLVLHTAHDARAQVVLRQAYTLLQKRAATIADPQLKHSFLVNVPANRNLIKAFEARAA